MTESNARRQEKAAAAIFAGRIDVLYALGRHYLSLPFAVLCVPATLIAGHAPGAAAADAAAAADRRGDRRRAAHHRLQATASPGSDPHFWARRYTFVSAIAGATWGVAALFWFVLGLLSRPRPICAWPFWA